MDNEKDDAPAIEIKLDSQLVAQTLQRKNAMLVSQLVYENATLETALEVAQREISDLRAKNLALKEAFNA